MLKRYLLLVLVCILILPPAPVFADGNKLITSEIESVIRIATFKKDKKGQMLLEGTGSGFVVDGKNRVVTNLHVVEGADEITVLDGGLGEHDYKIAKLLAVSGSLDLVILDVPTLKERQPLKIFKGKPVEVSQAAWAVGFPGVSDEISLSRDELASGLVSPTVTNGIITKTTTTTDWGDKSADVKILHHSAAVNHGNSGGPLLDECGDVIGVNTRIDSRDGNTLNKALNVTELSEFLSTNNVQYETADGKCDQGLVATSASQPEGQMGEGEGANTSWVTAAALGLIVLALVGIAILFMRRPGIPLTPKPAVDTRVDRPQASYRLQGLDGHEHLRFLLDKDNLRIGRSSSMNDYAVTHDSISRRHVNLRRENGEWLVADEGSTNGTAVNGQPLLPGQVRRLSANDILKLGEVSFAFSKA